MYYQQNKQTYPLHSNKQLQFRQEIQILQNNLIAKQLELSNQQNIIIQLKYQLQFCQQQLKQTQQTQNILKKQLEEHTVTSQQVKNHYQYQLLKKQYQKILDQNKKNNIALSRQRLGLSQNKQIASSYSNRVPSPVINSRKTIESRVSQSRGKSTIFDQRKTFTSTTSPSLIMPGCTIDFFFRSSTILNQQQRYIVAQQLSKVLGITLQKANLICSNQKQQINVSIINTMYQILNSIVIIELQNGQILGGYSQQRFPKQQLYLKQNKAAIFNVSKNYYISNLKQGQVMARDNQLIWGKNQFVIHCKAPFTLTINLKGSNSIFQTNYSNVDFVKSSLNKHKITKIQIYRGHIV